MKIVSVGSYQNTFSNKNTFRSNNIHAKGHSFWKTYMNELASEVQNEVVRYKNTYMNRFILLGKIGYDSQEKLSLVNKFEKELFNRKVFAENDKNFAEASKNARLYEKYQDNISDFERTVEFARRRDFFGSSDMAEAIKCSKAAMTENTEEPEKLKPLYIKFLEVKEKMQTDLEKESSNSIPEFFNKIKALDMQNKTAVMYMMISDYTETMQIIKDYENLFKEYNENGNLSYIFFNKISNLFERVQMFKERKPKLQENFKAIDEFLEENKNYQTENLSESTIKSTYTGLLNNADRIISECTKELEDYNAASAQIIDIELINKTLKKQESIISGLKERIAEARYGR